jgi:citrate synthase
LADNKVLLEVTENHLNTGLRGVPVGTCRTSYVTPTEGVHYCGYPISELAQFDPEDIVYLLFNKELPTPEQRPHSAKTLRLVQKSPETSNPSSKLYQSLVTQWIG